MSQLRNTIGYLEKAATHTLHRYSQDMDGPLALHTFTNACKTGVLNGIAVREMIFFAGGVKRGNGKTDNAEQIAVWREGSGLAAAAGWTSKIVGLPRPILSQPIEGPEFEDKAEEPVPIAKPKRAAKPKSEFAKKATKAIAKKKPVKPVAAKKRR